MEERINNQLSSSRTSQSLTHVGKSAAVVIDLEKKDLKEKKISLRTNHSALRSAHKTKQDPEKEINS